MRLHRHLPYHTIPYHDIPCLTEGIYWATGLSLTTPFTEGRLGVNNKASPPGRHQERAPKQRCTFIPTTSSSVQTYHGFSSVCYRRRNQWLRLALAPFCLPLTWLARVVYLLVGAAEGWGRWWGHACPCAATGYAMLRYGVGVGVGSLRGVCQKG